MTRVVAVAVTGFLFAAWVILWWFPGDTGDRWSWPISPELTPLFMGGGYGAGAFLFARLASTGRWHRAGSALPGIGAFATLVGIATIVHWDKFTHDSLAFWIWAGLYVTTPVLVPTLWLVNRRTDNGAPEQRDVVVPPGVRVGAAAFGAVTVVAGLACFVSVDAANAVWAWQLTPLTGKVLGAFLVEVGALGVVLGTESRWSGWRIPVQAHLLGFVLIAIGVARDWGSFEQRLSGAVWVAISAALLVALLVLYGALERRRREALPVHATT